MIHLRIYMSFTVILPGFSFCALLRKAIFTSGALGSYLALCAIATAQIVQIPDSNLEAALRAPDVLDKAEGDLTAADLQTVTSLNLAFGRFNDLTGLEFATNLEYLDLRYCFDINDISPLGGLPSLRYLNLSGCDLTNLHQLSALTALQTLTLRNLDLTDVGGLEDLNQLRELDLGSSDIGDISALQHLPELRVLHLKHAKIADLSPLAFLTNIRELDLNGVEIEDLSLLSPLTQLRRLDLTSVNIEDLGPLSSLTLLQELILFNGSFSDLSALRFMPHLNRLTIQNCPVRDITPLGGFTELTYLYLGNLQLTDVSALRSLTKLENLSLSGNHLELFEGGDDQEDIEAIKENNPSLVLSSIFQYPIIPDPQLLKVLTEILRSISHELAEQPLKNIQISHIEHIHPDFYGISGITDLTGLQYCTNLKTLDLTGSDVQNLEPISNLTSLEELYLDGNQHIMNLWMLGNMRNLKSLGLNGTNTDNLDFLLSMRDLQFLDAGNNTISDLSPLLNSTTIRSLNLAGNQVEEIQVLANLTELQSVFLEDNPLPLETGSPNVETILSLQRSGVGVTYELVMNHQSSLDFQDGAVKFTVGPIFLRDQVRVQSTTNLADPESWRDLADLEPITSETSGEWSVNPDNASGNEPIYYRAEIRTRY